LRHSSDRFQQHPIWAALDALGPALDSALSREGIAAGTIVSVGRLKAVLTFVGKRLAGADGQLVQHGHLDALTNAITAATNEVQAFVSNGNVGHLNNASNNLDSGLTTLSQINVPLTTEEFLGAKESAEAFRRGVEGALTEVQEAGATVRSELDATAARVAELNAQVNAEKQRLTGLANEHQSQFSAAQESRSRESAALHKEQQDRFAAMAADQTQAFTAKAAEFAAMLGDAQKQHAERLESLAKSFVGAADAIRAQLLQRQAEVEKLVGVVGNLALTSGYQKAAAAARKAAGRWQIATVVSMVALVGVALKAFLPALENGFAWSGFAGRVFISFTVAVLAAYSARQADKYQRAERTAEKMALELEALGPFLAPLPKTQQDTFRLTVGDRSFGRSDGNPAAHDKSPATVLDMIGDKDVRSLITEIVKAAK
jgi:hypothetical protein